MDLDGNSDLCGEAGFGGKADLGGKLTTKWKQGIIKIFWIFFLMKKHGTERDEANYGKETGDGDSCPCRCGKDDAVGGDSF